MMNTPLKIKEIFSTSWKAVMANFWILVGVYIGYTILFSLLSILVGNAYALNKFATNSLEHLFIWISATFFALGYLKNIFQALDGIEPQFSAYIKQGSKFFIYLFANILYTIIILIGLLFFLIPGIYLAIRLQYFYAFIVEEDAGIIESLKKSWIITKGHVRSLLLLFLTMIGITLVGLLLLIVGVFVAAPIINAMYAESFRKLNPLKESERLSEDYTL